LAIVDISLTRPLRFNLYLPRLVYLIQGANIRGICSGDCHWKNLSEAYLRLAEQADRNDMTDITLEPPPPKIDNPDRKQ
jgi:hypothetical protein